MSEETTQLNTQEDRSIKTDGTEKWQDAYNNDPELANSPVLANFKTPNDALKGLGELKAYQGRSVKLLGEDATPEEKAAWVEKIRTHIPGVTIMPNPEDEEDYARFQHDLGVPKDGAYEAPADVQLDAIKEEGIEKATTISKKLNLTQTQHANLLKELNQANVEVQEAVTAFRAEEDAKLSQKWGDAKDENLGIIQGIAKQAEDADVPLPDIKEWPNSFKLALNNLAKMVSSDPQTFSQQTSPKTQKTPAEIRARQAELFTILTKHGGRDLGGRKNAIQAEYQQTFDDLAKYK